MARSNNQKLKLLYIIKILEENTDENNMITTNDIIEKLSKYNIDAERKSIYDDLQSLEDFGYDIISQKGKYSGYTLGTRKFQLAELKLLVDAVLVAKFITQKKSEQLIKKLSTMASKNDSKQFERELITKSKVKTMNESIYYNIDAIYQAFLQNKQITFQYTQWTIKKELKPKKNGDKYKVSPWALTWDDENYYLIAYEESSNLVKHYRVDKMKKIEPTGEERMGKDHFKNFDLSTYSSMTFGMFGGTPEKLTILFPNSMTGPIIDRFGKSINLRKYDENSFEIRTDIVVSNQFFGWLSGLGPGSKILKPESVADKYKKFLKDLLNEYK